MPAYAAQRSLLELGQGCAPGRSPLAVRTQAAPSGSPWPVKRRRRNRRVAARRAGSTRADATSWIRLASSLFTSTSTRTRPRRAKREWRPTSGDLDRLLIPGASARPAATRCSSPSTRFSRQAHPVLIQQNSECDGVRGPAGRCSSNPESIARAIEDGAAKKAVVVPRPILDAVVVVGMLVDRAAPRTRQVVGACRSMGDLCRGAKRNQVVAVQRDELHVPRHFDQRAARK
jgi:hypothetical protein